MNQHSFGMEPQGPEPKRILLAGILMTAMLLVFNTFFAPTPQASKPPAPINDTHNGAAALQDVEKKSDSNKPKTRVRNATDSLPENIEEFEVTVRKNLGDAAGVAVRGGYKAQFTNQGGQIKSVALTGYQKPLTLGGKNFEGNYLTGLQSISADFTLRPNDSYKQKSKTETGIIYERLTPEGVRVTRAFELDPKDFAITQNITLVNETKGAMNMALELNLATSTNLDGEASFFTPGVSGFSAVCQGAEDRQSHTMSELEKEIQSHELPTKYMAIDERYFLMAWVPGTAFETKRCSARDFDLGSDSEKGVMLQLAQRPFILSAGKSVDYSMVSYLGPKQLQLLQAAGHNLEENVNFGWFGVISRPLLWLLVVFYDLIQNFGIAIILLTVFVKLITFPLTQKSFVSMQKMKTVAPELKKIQKKYGHDRTQLGQKQLEFYKEKGINPMAGCLPMLIQMPIWFALYQMLWNSIELFQQPFFWWIHDLTQPDPFFIFPVVMGVSMFIQTMFQPTPEDQPQMKYIMMGMPVFLTFIMLSMPAGLSLYILTNNILTIFQQMYIKRKYGDGATETA